MTVNTIEEATAPCKNDYCRGGLARIYDVASVLGVLEFVSDDEPGLIDEIRAYITDVGTIGDGIG